MTTTQTQPASPLEAPAVVDRRRHEVDAIVDAAAEAARAFRKLDQQQVDAIVEAMVRAGVRAAAELASVAIEETGFGVFEDKVVKNYVATEFLHDYLRGKKSVGVVDEDVEANIAYVAEPIGVVLAITPVTNPTSTVLFKAIVAAKTRNASPFPTVTACGPLLRTQPGDPPHGGRSGRNAPGGATGHPRCRARGDPLSVQTPESRLHLGDRRTEDRLAGEFGRQAGALCRSRQRPDLHSQDGGPQGRGRRHPDLENL